MIHWVMDACQNRIILFYLLAFLIEKLIMDNHTMASTTDTDLFVDSHPMNDEELTKLHESTLQMFRSNKIGPKNAFDIVLIDYLPAIFETTTFEDDHINNFQSVGTTLETSG